MDNNQKQQLGQLFAERLPVKLKQLARSLELLSRSHWPSSSLDKFALLVERIQVSCRNFEHTEAETVVKGVADVIASAMRQDATPDPEQVARIIGQLQTLAEPESVASRPVTPPGPAPEQKPERQGESLGHVSGHGNDEHTAADGINISDILREERVYLLLQNHPIQNHQSLDELASQLGYFGYHCTTFDSADSLRRAAEEQAPAAIMVHLNHEAPVSYPAETVMPLNRDNDIRIPLFFISQKDNLELRLQAVRDGSDGFFPEPVDTSWLIECLDELSIAGTEQPYRLLLMEDSKAQAKYFSRIFTSAGIEVCAVHHPSDISEALVNFQPELIIMDMLMPVCSGLELAMVIKQQEKYKHLPIVYLSANNDAMDKLEQLTIAGEDFLTKSIRSEQLLQAIQLRLRRARANAVKLASNHLTGLLSSSHFYTRLVAEIKRARREHAGLTFVLLNIEHLQKTNEQYGYIAGDRAIKSLANLLKQRLRHSDVIGHYGKSDFAVILGDCPKPQAESILQQLLTDYCSIVQQVNGQSFSNTFCFSITELQDLSVEGLQQAALDALTANKASRDQ